jgi:hypothetical protein
MARMNATPSANETADRPRRAAALLALTSLVVASQVAAQDPQDSTAAQDPAAMQPQTAAVLKLREIDFVYRSSVAHLSCSALQGRVATILRVLGARDDVQVRADGCDAVVVAEEPMESWQDPTDRSQTGADRWQSTSSRLHNRGVRREQSAHVRVRFMMPVEVTPEVLAEIERDKSRRELVSRVTRNPAASLNEPIVFPAQRQLVTLSNRTIGLEPEDCELLEQMSSGVFRRLGMRVVRRGHGCDRDQVSRIPPHVTVEALMPVIPRAPQLAPAAGASDSDPSSPAAPEGQSSEPATVVPPEQ